MFRRFHVFLDQGDGGGGDNGNGAGDNGGTKLEKTGWTSAVKDEIFEKHGEDLLKHENINSVLTDYFGQKEKLSKAIVKPGENASDEEVKAYREAMDIPFKAEDYELGEIPDGAEKDENFDNWIKEKSHELGLSKKQTKEFYKDLKSYEAIGRKAQLEAKEKAKSEAEKAMRVKYGNDYDATMAKVSRILDFGGEEFKTMLNETGLGNTPGLVEVLAKLGNMISEDSLGNLKGGTEPKSLSIAERLYPSQGKT